MDRQGDEVHVTDTEASGGSKPGVVRWVLGIGLILALVFMTIVWVTGAAVQDDGADSETSVSNRIQAEASDDERGEPVPPAFEDSDTSADAATTEETVGDAPEGDPRPAAE